MNTRHDYDVVARYFDKEWKSETEQLKNVTFQEAGRVASTKARILDELYPQNYLWRVDIFNPDKPEYGSYYQLFHGRLS